MANEIPSVDGISTKFFLAANATYANVAALETAIGTAEEIENVTTSGNIDFGTWAVNTLSVFGGGFKKSIGGQTAGNMAISVVFDAANETGQADLVLAHATAGTKSGYRNLILQLDDEPETGASPHPTYIVCNIKVVALAMPVTMDSAVTYDVTIEFMELPTIREAAATTV